MSWRDRLAQRDRAARANAISAKSAVSPLIGPFGTNGTIGKAGLSDGRAAERAVTKLDYDTHEYFAESTPNCRSIAGVVTTGSADERDLASDSSGWTDVQNERAAFVEYGARVPLAWAEAFARLDPNRPPGAVPRKQWLQYIDDCGRFLDDGWAGKAAAFGWGPLDLFGCDREHPFPRIGRAGLLWLLNGNKLLALSEITATIETPVGVRWMVRRCSDGPDHLVLPWEPAP
jgi:hypothetical protein